MVQRKVGMVVSVGIRACADFRPTRRWELGVPKAWSGDMVTADTGHPGDFLGTSLICSQIALSLPR
jgi:hypothetical protein